MTAAPSPLQKRLDAIRNRAGLASRDWGVMAGLEGFCLTAAGGEIVATFAESAAYDDRELICHAPDDLRFMLEIYDRLSARYRRAAAELAKRNPPPKDFAAECAIKCEDPLFLRFLRDEHGVDTSDTLRVASRIRTMLAIQSRAELNTNDAAKQRWLSLRSQFDNWRHNR
ncbi:MAG: hypothetical protein QHC90_25725 [Shinella sp.]|nr:hypothetical protein [Shinella sp.]